MFGNFQNSHYRRAASRRDFFTRVGSGLAGVALAQMLQEDGLAATSAVDPMNPKKPDHPPTAKSIIWLFMEGGPSHVDLFDPKPKLQELAGQPLPDSMRPKFTAMPGTSNNGLMPSKRTFKQYGQSGLWVSDWYPNIAQHVDDMTVIRSCWTDGINHLGGVTEMNSGSILSGRPSLGAWVNYGLGSANRNLPSFVVMLDDRDPIGGPKQWGSGFLPATFQGMQFRQGDTPLLHLKPPNGMTDTEQRKELGLLKHLNEIWSADKQDDSELDARIRSYELAYKMQSAAPEVVDLSKESDATKKLYGMDVEETRAYGQNCLLARRLVERGVRFVELYCGSGSGWDAHDNVETNHSKWCKASDVANRRSADRSESAWPTQGHACRLGRRIRAHAFQRKGPGPRPQSLGLHDLDGRWRREGRPVYRRDRRTWHVRHGAPVACERHSCDHALGAGPQPFQRHLHAQRTRRASNGGGGRSHQGSLRVIAQPTCRRRP